MEYRYLGKNGPKVPVIGLGTWTLGGGMGRVDEKIAVDTIHAAIKNGITLIDTAEAYLESENIIGRALKGGYRSRCFLATKVSGDFSRKGIRSAVERSLRALKTDWVDLYQLHRWKPEYPIKESMETLKELQKEGKTRFIGVSNFNAQQMSQALKALDTAYFDSNQLCYNMYDREIEAEEIPFCREHGIGILSHSTLAKGLLAGKYTESTAFGADDERSEFYRFKEENLKGYVKTAEKLQAVAADKSLNLIQLSLAWALRKAEVSCSLVGAKKPEHILTYLGALDASISKEELKLIDDILTEAPKVKREK